MPRRPWAALLVSGGAVAIAMGAASVASAAPPPVPPPRREPPPEPTTARPPEGGVLEILPPAPKPHPRFDFPSAPAGRGLGDKLDRTLDASLHAYHRRLRVAGPFGPTFGGRDEAGGLRAVGDVGETGFSLRLGASIDGLRFGVGAGLAALADLRIERTAPGDDRRTLSLGKAFGTPVEAFLGYAYGRPDGIRPFVELRGSAALAHVSIGADGASGQSHTVLGASLGGRIGALILINQYFFADVGIGLGFVGAERVIGGAAIGVPIPFANL